MVKKVSIFDDRSAEAKYEEPLDLSQLVGDDDVWSVVEAMFNDPRHALGAQQTESFDNFIDRRIPLILEAIGTFTVFGPDQSTKVKLKINNPRLLSPRYKDQHGRSRKLWPSMALSHNHSYLGNLIVDIHYTNIKGEVNVYEDQVISSIPVMIGSRWCTTRGKSRASLLKHNEPLDNPGGYFIVRPKAEDGVAQEKVIFVYERAAHDKITVLARKSSNVKAGLNYYAEVKSHDIKVLFRQTTTVVKFESPKSDVLFATLPWHESQSIPLGILFKALGMTDDREIIEAILGSKWKEDPLLPIVVTFLEHSYELKTTEQALNYIGRKCKLPEKTHSTYVKKKLDDAEGEDEVAAEPAEADDAEGDAEGEGEDAEEEVDVWEADYLELADDVVDEDGEIVNLEEHLWVPENEKIDEGEKKKKVAKKKGPPEISDRSFALKILTNDLFPHLGEEGTDDAFLKKARYLAIATRKLIKTRAGIYPLESRDHYGNKRCITSGERLGHQFMTSLKKFFGDIYKFTKAALESKGYLNILGWMTKTVTLSNYMTSGVSSNAWLFKVVGASKGPKGLSQVLDNYSRVAHITQIRKLKVPSCESGKVEGPRNLSGDHFGNLCPETPEGKQSGLAKPTALSAVVTMESDPVPIKLLIRRRLDENIEKFPEAYSWTVIFVNGDLVGYTKFPKRITNWLISLRRGGKIDLFVSISYNTLLGEIVLLSDSGRVARPLLVVEKGRLAFRPEHVGLGWSDLLRLGVVEYLDVSEQDQVTLIAGYPSELTDPATKDLPYSHCEIHPSLMYGAGISTVPKPDHNQAPRNVYQAQMGRQAIGVSFSNYRTKFNGSHCVLHYPEKPLVTTRLAEEIGLSDYPNGYNVIAAIMCSPYNEEDGIEMSQSSIDLGLFRDTRICNYELRVKPEKKEVFGCPVFQPKEDGTIEPVTKKGNFRHINQYGYAEINSIVEKGDVILSKLTAEGGEEVEVYKEPLPGRVDSVFPGIDGDGYQFFRIQIHEVRTPVVGDKFAARHAQKGVIGRVTPTVDLPWSGMTGLRPDVIINALAFPSRMTIALVIEAIFGIIVSSGHILEEFTVDEIWGSEDPDTGLPIGRQPKPTQRLSDRFRDEYMLGDQVDGTPFKKIDLEFLSSELQRLGISMGEQDVYDGITGELVTTKVMFAPVYYQRLKHVVYDKFHARATGALNAQTRQPPEGRGHDGGLKYGVMEVDSSNASGIPYLTKDRLMDSSDATDMWCCEDCGSPGYRSKTKEATLCQYCSSYRLKKIKIPYGTKLMNQELEALNIVAKIIP